MVRPRDPAEWALVLGAPRRAPALRLGRVLRSARVLGGARILRSARVRALRGAGVLGSAWVGLLGRRRRRHSQGDHANDGEAPHNGSSVHLRHPLSREFWVLLVQPAAKRNYSRAGVASRRNFGNKKRTLRVVGSGRCGARLDCLERAGLESRLGGINTRPSWLFRWKIAALGRAGYFLQSSPSRGVRKAGVWGTGDGGEPE